jgi:hypothetical protein
MYDEEENTKIIRYFIERLELSTQKSQRRSYSTDALGSDAFY